MDHAVSALHRRCAGSWCLTAALVVICAAGATAKQVTVDCSPGNPSGSQFTSISAAVSHLNTLPALGDWDSILLRSDCTDNVYLTRSRIWITPEFDCPWNGCPNTPYRITAANPSQPVVSVEGPHDITLVHLILSGGVNGLTIANGGSVIADGVVAEKSGLNESVSITNGNGFVVEV